MNPGAPRAKEALSALSGFAQVKVHPIPGGGLSRALTSAVRAGATRVIVAGGDGTISQAATVVAGTSVPLAVVPAGTLNHFAKDLRLPLDLADACRIAVHSRAIRTLAIGRANDRVFLNTSSIGAYVRFVRARERLEPRLGYWIATIVAASRLLVRLPIYTVEIEAEGERRRYSTPLVFVGLGERELRLPKLGGRVEGGRTGLHVMVVRRRTGARVFALALAAAARGTRSLARGPQLDSFLVERCRIDLPGSTARIAIDGEIIETAGPVDYRVSNGALRIVVDDAVEASTE